MRGKLFIISAPAGAGKTTLVNRLVKELPNTVQSISYTTRQRREDEIDGVHYHFVTREAFEAMVKADVFLEHVTLYGDYYGTSKKAIEEKLSAGIHVIMVIDTQGALKLKGKIDCVYVFISPPSLDKLRERLELRKSESPERIEARLKVAVHELACKKYYQYEIINDDFEVAYQNLKKLIISEEKP